MSKINVRSPYSIYHTITNLTSAKLELYIYTGIQTTDRPSVTYTLESTAFDAKVTFEISELVRDFLDVTFNGTYTSQMVWVDYQITESVSGTPQTPLTLVALSGYDGWGYFKDGVNPQNDSDKLQSNSTICTSDTENVRIAVLSDGIKTVKFFKDGVEIYSITLAAIVVSSTIIQYIDIIAIYEARVLADGGTFEGSVCLDSFVLDGVDTITITTVSTSETITVKNVEECKYTPLKTTFINKFGAEQDLWFFKTTKTNLSTTDRKFKSNILVDGSYSVSAHQNKILNKQGSEKLTLNTGYYPESYNEIFEEFSLSEKVWIKIDGITLPVNVSSSSIDFKTVLNDDLVAYTINIDFANDVINSVR